MMESTIDNGEHKWGWMGSTEDRWEHYGWMGSTGDGLGSTMNGQGRIMDE